MAYVSSFEANFPEVNSILNDIHKSNSTNKAQLEKLSLLINSACRSNRKDDITYRLVIQTEYNKLSNDNKEVAITIFPHWKMCVFNPVMLPKLYNIDNLIKIIYDKKYKIYRVQYLKQNTQPKPLPMVEVSEDETNIKPSENWGDDCE